MVCVSLLDTLSYKTGSSVPQTNQVNPSYSYLERLILLLCFKGQSLYKLWCILGVILRGGGGTKLVFQDLCSTGKT